MCGWTSGLTLLYLAEGNNQLKFQLIDYCNSGDSPYGDKDEVVGYHAIALIEKNQKSEINNEGEKEFFFTEGRRRSFLQLPEQYTFDVI